MQIYCCQCQVKVDAVLTNGSEIYPHRPDLHSLPFWKCPTCKNFVGCHHKTSNRTAPLGCIPTKEIKELRKQIHAILDPMWKSGKISRRGIYKILSDKTGKNYHTAFIRSADEAKMIINLLSEINHEPQL